MSRKTGSLAARDLIRGTALELGFDAVGFARTDDFERERRWLAERFIEGRASSFEKMDIALRSSPRALLPDAETLVSLALAYPSPREVPFPRDGKLRGRVSSHSWGVDYHRVLARKLRALAKYIEEVGGKQGKRVKTRVFVDTGPLLERAVAERAGVGFIGKNTSLITQTHGSWVFLGEVLTTFWLPADTPLTEGCGDCDLCLRACPTGALLAPYKLDATRCLSQLTQEKGLPDENHRVALGRTLYGCEICQNVCPRNRDVLRYREPAFQVDADMAYPELLELFSMSNNQFEKKFGHIAGAWRHLSTWQRNALVVIGSRHDRRARGLLESLLAHNRVEMRALAAWGLGRIGSPESTGAIRARMQVEREPQVRHELEQALHSCTEESSGEEGL